MMREVWWYVCMVDMCACELKAFQDGKRKELSSEMDYLFIDSLWDLLKQN